MNVQIFNHPKFGDIRTTGTADEPLFCLADVCKVVGLTNPSNVKARLDKDDVQLIDLHALSSTEGTIIGNSMTNFVTESGFYDVILQSSSPNVKAFRKWVTSEVLPSIRKTGGYMIATADMTDEEIMARAIMIGQKTIERQKERIKALEKQMGEQQLLIDSQSDTIRRQAPKVQFADAVGKSTDTITIDLMAKLLAQNGVTIGEKRLFEWLRKNLYLSDQKSTWNRPYQKWIERGIFRVETSTWKNPSTGSMHTSYTPRITPKGQEYFVRLFLKSQPTPIFGAVTRA